MKKFLFLLITTAVTCSCEAQTSLISDSLYGVVKNMGVTLTVDSTATYPNGGKLITVRYPKGLLTGDAVFATDTLESGTVLNMIGAVNSGSQNVAGATKITILSANSFRIVREIDGKEDIAYIFEPHRAVRYYQSENGEIVTEQVLP